MSPPATDLRPGDVVGCRGASGRWYLLVVRAVRSRTDGRFPIVDVLDFDGSDVPDQDRLQALTNQLPGRVADGDPWWVVTATVRHVAGGDFDDLGFTVVGRIPPLPASYEHHLVMAPPASTTWVWWRRYLDAIDRLHGPDPDRARSWLDLVGADVRWQQWWLVVPDDDAAPTDPLWPAVSALDRFHLGVVGPGVAGQITMVARVAAVLPELGAVPVAALPVLDDALCDDLVAAFDAAGGVDPAVFSRADLVEFLGRRRGRRIASHESDTAFSPHTL